MLTENSIVAAEDRPLYEYGLHQLEVTILNLVTAILLGLAVHMLWQALLFLAAYIPLRKFAGGYHAKTELRCYILSTSILAIALLVLYNLNTSGVLILPLSFVGSVMVWFLAPVENPNKPLDTTEYAVYRKRSRVILGIHGGIVLISLLLAKQQVAFTIAVANMVLFGMLIMGTAKNQFTVSV